MDSFIIRLYKKFLYGNISREELKEMRHGINNTTDELLSRQMEEEWSGDFLNESLSKDTKDRLRGKLDFYIENDNRRRKKRLFMRIAAIMIPVFFVSTLFVSRYFSPDSPGHLLVTVERGNKAMVTLPDNSKVWMNSNSTLEYNNVDKVREVKLTGEAFFKVSKDKKRPFVVTMNELQIEVLGTSFNAKSRTYSDVIETMLIEGSVKLRSPELPHDYYLKPNEKAIYSRINKKLEIVQAVNSQETAWKENKLRFNSNRFIDAMAILEDWYGVRIINQVPGIENDLISGTFNNEKLETVLDALKMQYRINYVMDKDRVIILNRK